MKKSGSAKRTQEVRKAVPTVGMTIDARAIVKDLTGLNDPVAGFINQSELNKLLEQNNALKVALQPFATFLVTIHPTCPNHILLDPTMPNGPTVGDIRRASMLLDFLNTAQEATFLANFQRKVELSKGPNLPKT